MLVIHRTPFAKLLCGSPDFLEKIPPNTDIWHFNREMAAVNKCQHLARPAVSISPLSMDGLRWRDKWHQMVDNFQIVLKRLWNVFYTGMPHFIARCFIVLCVYCVSLNEREGSWQPFKSIGAVFPTSFAHFVSVSHFGNPHIFQTFPLLWYLLWWSVISRLWCYYCNWFGAPRTAPT